MELNDASLLDKGFWESRGYKLPGFDRALLRERTVKEPVWVHFGVGNIFRAYIAVAQQRLLDEGLHDRGIIAAEGYDFELVDIAYKPFDDLSISVTLMPDGSVKKTVVGSIAESIVATEDGMERLREVFASKSLQIASFTITEKGYDFSCGDGTLQDIVSQDLENKPELARSFLGKLTVLCLHRYQNGAYPLALVSMDNCSNNGIRLRNAVSRFAKSWVKNGFADADFIGYISDDNRLSFPCTMIDKITPYPDDYVARMLAEDGIEGMTSSITAKMSVTAPFVNSEDPEYLVIEDIFPGGRPPLEKAGVMFTDRETVDKAEKMKVSTCLNPLHTALSVLACLLSYTKVSDAMKDEEIFKLVHAVAQEGLPVVTDPIIISPAEFIDTVIKTRLPNPYIPDTPQRIATDTSRKLAVRFGETIKEYQKRSDLDVNTLCAIPLVFAGWCRYLMGVDDEGNAFKPDPDPMLEELCPLLADITLGANVDCTNVLRPILTNSEIFGVDLFDAGLAGKVIEYFRMMIKGKGAVRRTLSLGVRG